MEYRQIFETDYSPMLMFRILPVLHNDLPVKMTNVFHDNVHILQGIWYLVCRDDYRGNIRHCNSIAIVNTDGHVYYLTAI